MWAVSQCNFDSSDYPTTGQCSAEMEGTQHHQEHGLPKCTVIILKVMRCVGVPEILWLLDKLKNSMPGAICALEGRVRGECSGCVAECAGSQ